jgi:hypothetical protein
MVVPVGRPLESGVEAVTVATERTAGYGLDGHPCPERAALDQNTPNGMRPCQAMCIRCGRVTARRDSHGYAWCAGEAPEPQREDG